MCNKTETKPIPESVINQNWRPVFDLASTMDELLRTIAASLLEIRKDQDTLFTSNPDLTGLYDRIAQEITAIKQQAANYIADIPKDPDTEVTEEIYPVYLDTYVNLSNLSNHINESVLETLEQITMIVADHDEKDTQQ